MKVNFDKMRIGTKVNELPCGATFAAKRTKPHADETALYIVIDKYSGIFKPTVNGKICALNLSTGQIRLFEKDTCVTPVDAEVFEN